VPDPGASFKGTYREEAWRRCGRMAESDGIVFTPWPHTDRYPNWSLPALEAAKCVSRQAPELFGPVHIRLYAAFFTDSRNIADRRDVERIVADTGIDAERFRADYRAGVGRDEVLADYKEAAQDGVRSIPTVILPATGQALVGLADLAQYRAAIQDAARC
jgi:predicted DsbA family dithiol-disulfide isomerase